MIKKFIIFSVCISTFLSCENVSNEENETPILSSFTQPFDDKGVNLNRILGDSIILKKNNAEVVYYIEYSRSDNSSTISDKNGQILYQGPVGRYRGYYYFTQNSPDSLFWINAVEIQDNMVKGFLEPEAQMRILDDTLDFWLTSETERPPYLTKANESGISIIPDKKLMNSLFTHVLAKLPFDTIINSEPTKTQEAESDKPSNTENAENSSYVFISEIFPNPAKEYSNLVFKKKGNYQINIFNLNGQVIQNEQCNCQELKIDLNNLETGVYNITVTAKGKKQTDSIKLIKQ